MKRLIKVLLVLIFIYSLSFIVLADVHVKGYYRSNGTYVKPHYRSDPDNNFSNNWSTKGNVNPYTGAIGTKKTPGDSVSSTYVIPNTTYTQLPATVNPVAQQEKTNRFSDLIETPSEQKKSISVAESYWQVALNNNYFKGKMETILSTGRADIETDTQVVEVDKVSKYLEGIEQALKYAKATGKKPVLALYIDGESNGYDLLKSAEKLCNKKKVKLILANCYVSTNDLINLINISQTERTKSQNIDETVSRPTINRFSDLTEPKPKEQTEKKYWITTSSGVRHNSSCRYYMNSKGRMCTKNEGRACKICGG